MRLRFVLSETGKGLARNKAMAVAVVIVTYVSLLFVGVAALAQIQVNMLKSDWYDKIEVSIYMCAIDDRAPSCDLQEATEEQIDEVRTRLASADLEPYVETVYEETKEEAFEAFQQAYGDTALADWTSADMLQFSFRVKLVDPEQYEIIQEEFGGSPGVSEVRDQRELVEPMFNVIEKAKMLSLALAAIMVVAAVLLITVTIRLSAMSRERETQIMRLVGASNLFIQAPFMIEGAVAALVGAGLAVGSLFGGVHLLVNNWLAGSFTWARFISYSDVWLITPLLVGAALLLALVASAISLAKYTRV
ncbi:permease-like cell division protein FtsX [Actinomyces minihominis]|uniref:permease-like cell division protein FtsX n=1 Tax=Actinomyces minihominis TaxID=2002838 RepID=UPI000C08D650|nr:permease-like cell division protein FtsX [Actinomyces minihominis]